MALKDQHLDITKVKILLMEAPTDAQVDFNTIRQSEYGSFIFDACIQTVDTKNRNQGVYRFDELDEVIKSEHIQSLIRQKDFCGENGHPDPERKIPFSQIDPNNVCCRYNRIWWDGVKLMAEVETTLDAKGPDFKKSIIQKRIPSFSFRGTGGFYKDAAGNTRRRLHGITWDRVVLPSHHDANGDITKVRGALSGSPAGVSANLMMEAPILNFDKVIGNIREFDRDMSILYEGMGETPDKILYDKKNNVIGYMTEGALITHEVKKKEYIDKLNEMFTKVY
jgi:hypothetical protein